MLMLSKCFYAILLKTLIPYNEWYFAALIDLILFKDATYNFNVFDLVYSIHKIQEVTKRDKLAVVCFLDISIITELLLVMPLS